MVVVAVEVTVTALESLAALRLGDFLAARDIAVVELVVSSRTDFLATGKSRPRGLPKT